jgi:hypothetical protein
VRKRKTTKSYNQNVAENRKSDWTPAQEIAFQHKLLIEHKQKCLRSSNQHSQRCFARFVDSFSESSSITQQEEEVFSKGERKKKKE